jgi:CRP/FNR family transcriptional regulator, cyclic AMP receptor protein
MTTHEPLTAGDPDTVRVAIASHPFCAGFEADDVTAIAEGASERTVSAGELVIRHGEPADALYLLVEGDVALEITDPAHEPLTVETLHGGDALGWSWLYPPHAWVFDARSRSTSRLLCIDATHLRRLMDDDPRFGRDLALRVGAVVVERLQFSRAQLVDAHLHDRP